MSFKDDVIIDASVENMRKLTPVEEQRKEYVKIDLSGLVGETYPINKFVLTEINTDTKISQNGKSYKDNQCMLKAYNDEYEEVLICYIKNFNDYNEENNTLTLRLNGVNRPLAEFLSSITGDTVNNRWTVHYNAFMDAVNNLEPMNVEIKEYERNNYVNYYLRKS